MMYQLHGGRIHHPVLTLILARNIGTGRASYVRADEGLSSWGDKGGVIPQSICLRRGEGRISFVGGNIFIFYGELCIWH